jgi:hypothetical protein
MNLIAGNYPVFNEEIKEIYHRDIQPIVQKSKNFISHKMLSDDLQVSKNQK